MTSVFDIVKLSVHDINLEILKILGTKNFNLKLCTGRYNQVKDNLET